MKQFTIVILCVAPSAARAATGEPATGTTLNLSGEATTALMRKIQGHHSQSSQPQSQHDEKLLGMHPSVTLTLFTVGIGAALGALAGPNKDAEGNELPLTGADRPRRAAIGAGVLTGAL